MASNKSDGTGDISQVRALRSWLWVKVMLEGESACGPWALAGPTDPGEVREDLRLRDLLGCMLKFSVE